MFRLVELHQSPAVKQISGFAAEARRLAQNWSSEIACGYDELLTQGPERLKDYYVRAHNGRPTRSQSNHPRSSQAQVERREEHLAMALYNAGSKPGFHLQIEEARELVIVDYQFPLKAKRSDHGIGKIDLWGFLDCRTPAVVELKVKGRNGLGDTPLRALLEALTHCAIVEKNLDKIARETRERFRMPVDARTKPCLLILAPGDYWDGYLRNREAQAWPEALASLAEQICTRLQIIVYFRHINNINFEMGNHEHPPRLTTPGGLQVARASDNLP